jgi:AraC-like DNA-binding protein
LFGISPIRDLIAARVDRAKVLLLENESETLAQVAERLGYKNQYDFSRQFKQVAGISPGTYRKNNRS